MKIGTSFDTMWRMNKLWRIGILAALTLALLSMALPAAAHGYIVRAIPEDRATLERAPVRVQYWFSEDLEPDYSSLILRDQTGAVLATGGVDESNQSLMSLRVPNDLPDGGYIVELRPAFSSDGHVSGESRVFFVGEEVGGIAGSSSYQVITLEIIWRVIVLSAVMLLMGAFVVYSAVLVPAWGNNQYKAGLLPPRVMWTLNAIVIAALIAAFAGNILALIQQAMVFFNTGAVEVISQGLINVVRIGSRFGDVWNIRMLLLILVAALHGVSIYLRDRLPEMVHALWAGNVWVVAILFGTFSMTSHAAGSLLWPWTGVFVDWLHGAAVGAWVGGLAAFTLILRVALRPYEGDARRLALLTALRRFSRLAAGAVVVVITTGIYSSLNWLNEPSEITGTAWGGALVIKVVLVAGLLVLGLLHQIVANPERYTRWSQLMSGAGRLAITLRLEVLVALGVLVAVANLSATPVPEPRFLEQSIPALSASQTIDDLIIDMTVTPGGAGVNTFDIEVTQPNVDVSVQLVNPAEDRRGQWMVAEAVDQGLFVTASGDINKPGRWWALVNIMQGETLQRAAFEWNITQDALPTRSPGLLNYAALAGVIAACVWALLPALQRLYRWLDWSPASATTAAVALVITFGFIIFGYIVVQRGQADYEAAINPPPKIINPILPDGNSLEQGKGLFRANCIWNPALRDVMRLRERIPDLRDEQLFAITSDGWQNLPACNENLSDEERWHIVNYLRVWR